MRSLGFLLGLLFSYNVLALDIPDYAVKYDPARDAAQDLKQALADANESQKLVLIEIGGDWCIWCHRLDKFLHQDESHYKELTDIFVLMKVNASEENMNESFLSQFGKIPGYPHLLILAPKGDLLLSKSTSGLEQGESYSIPEFKKFMGEWRKAREVIFNQVVE